MDQTEGLHVAEAVAHRLAAHRFESEVTGHLRLGLATFKRPYLLVAPPDVNQLARIFNTTHIKPNILIEVGDHRATLVPAARDHWGAFQILYTGPWGFVRYLAKRAHNMGYHWLSKGARPGLYHRQSLVAALYEWQIFDVLGFEPERRSFEFRRRFRQNWWHAGQQHGASVKEVASDGSSPHT